MRRYNADDATANLLQSATSMGKRETGEGDSSSPDWKKTTVYLRKDQIRRLKQAGLDGDVTMSDVLRQCIDHFFGLDDTDPRLSAYQRETIERVLRERLTLDQDHVAAVLTVLDSINADD